MIDYSRTGRLIDRSVDPSENGVQMLAETVKSVGFEQTVKSVVPLLGPLAAVSGGALVY